MQSLRLCGSILTKKPDLVKLLKKQREEVIKFRRKKNTYYFRLLTGGAKRNHFHLETAHRNRFGKNFPTATGSRKTIKQIFEAVRGQKINVSVVAAFTEKFADLPERGMIRLVSVDTRTGDVGIRLKGGIFGLKGSPVSSLSWSLRPDETVLIYIFAIRHEVIDETYMIRAQKWIQGLYELFVLGKEATLL